MINKRFPPQGQLRLFCSSERNSDIARTSSLPALAKHALSVSRSACGRISTSFCSLSSETSATSVAGRARLSDPYVNDAREDSCGGDRFEVDPPNPARSRLERVVPGIRGPAGLSPLAELTTPMVPRGEVTTYPPCERWLGGVDRFDPFRLSVEKKDDLAIALGGFPAGPPYRELTELVDAWRTPG